jgi:hypothetical protein
MALTLSDGIREATEAATGMAGASGRVGLVLVRPGERLAAHLEGRQAEVRGFLGRGQGERPTAHCVQVKRRHGAAFSRRALPGAMISDRPPATSGRGPS